jgi:thiol-disulfide isomerase/thioredoxin
MRHVLLLFFLLASPLLMADELSLSDGKGAEITVETLPAPGDLLMIWLVDHTDRREMFEGLLQALNRQGVEIWRVDLLASYFLQRSRETIRTLPGDGVASVIAAAHRMRGKRILLAAYDRMPLPLLRGVRLWQSGNPDSRLVGAILLYPNLFGPPPPAGEAPVIDPVLQVTNIPLAIFQPALGSQRWRITQMLTPLWQAGSPAYAYLVPEVRDWFIMGETDHGPGDRRATELLPQQILRFAALLDRYPKPPAAPSRVEPPTQTPSIRTLTEVTPAKPAPRFDLSDLSRHAMRSDQYAGDVVLVNFWATWCPPCVEELPSLNHLTQRYAGQHLRVVSILFREAEDDLTVFLQHTPVDFPVLMDRDGRTALAWQVFSFPSSFILDRRGRIRYAANRAIDWDSQDVWSVIERLLAEPKHSD